MIISASRRTDLPAFHADGFLERLRAGSVTVRNPMNAAQVREVSLKRADVDAIVFWSKDPLPLLGRLGEVEDMGFPYYFQFTLTPYGPELEPGLRVKAAVVETFQTLSQRLGPWRVVWRYDPIVLNGDWTAARHAEAFERLCVALAGWTETCVISFVDVYPKLRKAVRAGWIREIAPEEMMETAARFAQIGRRHGIGLRACSEALDLTGVGVARGACVDAALVERLCGRRVAAGKAVGQRPGCGCCQSVDVGAYHSCGFGCVYCYAR